MVDNKIEFNEPKQLMQVMNITHKCWDMYKNKLESQEMLKLFADWNKFRIDMLEYLKDFDVIITPVATCVAHPIKDTPSENIPFTLTYSLLKWPCAKVRVDTTNDGLPINVQVVAAPYHEEVCLLVAKTLEDMCGWQSPDL